LTLIKAGASCERSVMAEDAAGNAPLSRAEGGMQRLDDSEHLRAGYPVVNRRPLAASLDQPVGPQPHELLRHRHLIDVQEFSQLSHGALLVAECAQHEQPLRMG